MLQLHQKTYFDTYKFYYSRIAGQKQSAPFYFSLSRKILHPQCAPIVPAAPGSDPSVGSDAHIAPPGRRRKPVGRGAHIAPPRLYAPLVKMLSLRTSDRRHWCGNPFSGALRRGRCPHRPAEWHPLSFVGRGAHTPPPGGRTSYLPTFCRGGRPCPPDTGVPCCA